MLHPLKSALKRFEVFRQANALVKASALAMQRARLASSYERRARALGITYDAARVPELLAGRLRARGIDPASIPERPGVLWVGVDLQQDRGGFLQSLERNSELTSFHRASGEYGIQFKSDDGIGRPDDLAMIRRNSERLLALVHDRMRSGPPLHLLIGQLWSQVLTVEALREVQRLGIVTVNVSMDDRLPLHWQHRDGRRLGSVGLAAGLDLVLTTSPETCEWYAVEGATAFFWPLASDPEVFVPASEEQKVHDICFVGQRYGVRDQIVSALLDAGINVSAFGPGWPAGPIPADQVASVFATSRMILGSGTIAHNRRTYTLKLRDFDAPMAGSLYLTHRNPDLLPLFEEGREIECYGDTAELVDKVRRYLDDPGRRIDVARRGRERALRDHTWDVRFDQLFSLVRGVQPRRPHPALSTPSIS